MIKDRAGLVDVVSAALEEAPEGSWENLAELVLIALDEAGVCLVPTKYPTRAMYDALREAYIGCEFHDAAWAALLSASPYRP